MVKEMFPEEGYRRQKEDPYPIEQGFFQKMLNFLHGSKQAFQKGGEVVGPSWGRRIKRIALCVLIVLVGFYCLVKLFFYYPPPNTWAIVKTKIGFGIFDVGLSKEPLLHKYCFRLPVFQSMLELPKHPFLIANNAETKIYKKERRRKYPGLLTSYVAPTGLAILTSITKKPWLKY